MKYYDKEEKELIEWYESESDHFKPVSSEEDRLLQAIFQQNLKNRVNLHKIIY